MTSQEQRKGGLGRGLAALITGQPDSRLGTGAADIIIGGSNAPTEEKKPAKAAAAEKKTTKATSASTPPKRKPAKRDATGARINPIISEAVAAKEAQAAAEAPASEQVDFGASYQEIPVGLLIPNVKNPRKVFDDEDLDELVHSIKEFGLLQPIVVRAAEDGHYEIIMGERRWRAAAKAGVKTIPAIIRETADNNMLRDALLENIHRVQLNPLEEAAAYEQLLKEFGVTQHELADRLGRSRPVITNMLRLLQLPVSVQRKVAAGVLTAGHARALLGLKAGKKAQEALAEKVVAESLSVRATEEAVTLLNRGDKALEQKKRIKPPTPEFLTHAADLLADNLDTKVSVSMGKRKGKIVVEFGGREDFERIMSLLRHQG